MPSFNTMDLYKVEVGLHKLCFREAKFIWSKLRSSNPVYDWWIVAGFARCHVDAVNTFMYRRSQKATHGLTNLFEIDGIDILKGYITIVVCFTKLFIETERPVCSLFLIFNIKYNVTKEHFVNVLLLQFKWRSNEPTPPLVPHSLHLIAFDTCARVFNGNKRRSLT